MMVWRHGRLWRRGLTAAALAVLVALPVAARPQRVVSLNLCTDLLALDLALPGQLVSVTYWSLRGAAADRVRRTPGLHINHGHAEDVIPLNPDLVLAGRFGARATVLLLRDLGYRVEVFDVPQDFAGVRAQVRRLAQLLGTPERGARMLADFDAAIGTTDAVGARPRAVLYTPDGGSAGRGTIVDAVLRVAGYRNLASDLGLNGWSRLPLERLLLERPDVLVFSLRGGDAPSRAREILGHPALAHFAAGRPVVNLPPDIWDCPGPPLAKAVARLREVRP